MSTDYTLEIVPLDAIDWRQDDNPRVFDDLEARVANLFESDPDSWEPIVVAPIGGGRYRGIDGFARSTTADRRRRQHLRARIEQMPTDVRDRSFELNRIHGFHLSIGERKAHARYLHDRYPDLSWAEIGKRCTISDHTAKVACMEGDDPDSQIARVPLRELADDHPRVIYAFLRKLVVDRASWRTAERAAHAIRSLIPEDQYDDFLDRLGRSAEAALDIAEALGYGKGETRG